jgi:outer membrane biosynthesis protein TonB
MHSKMMERIMRLLAATLGALLISVSHPALSQEHYRSLPHALWQQGEDSRQSEAQQAEQRPEFPQPQTEQAEVQPPVTPEPQTEQAAMPQPAMPEPQTEQTAMPQPAMPEPQTEQTAMPQPAMPEPQAEQAAMPQPAMPEPQVEQTAIQQPATPEPVTQGMAPDIALPRDARWTVFVEPSLGTRMDLPSAVFATADGAAYRGVGRQFKTADGRAAVAIYSQRNNQRDTPASYLRKNFSFPRTTVTYERVTRDFFAVSGVRDDKIFYSRCNVSATGGTLHCFDMQFPAAEKAAWDAIVTRMSRSLRPLHRS